MKKTLKKPNVKQKKLSVVTLAFIGSNENCQMGC